MQSQGRHAPRRDPWAMGTLYGSIDRDRARTLQEGRGGETWSRSAPRIQPSYAAAAMLGMCRPSVALDPRALFRTYLPPASTCCQRQLQLGCRSALVSLRLLCYVTGSRGCSPKAAGSGFGLLSARIPPPGPLHIDKSSAAEAARPARCRPPSRRPACPSAGLHSLACGLFLFPQISRCAGWSPWLREALIRAPGGLLGSGHVVHGLQPPYQAGVGSMQQSHLTA
ncbi:hypothetical protein QBC39DRAFT_187451 [Podospora conica]|nr:hypothetical protein QBC39DRAFT_187451 [Schizothecium conicum]